MTTGKTCLRIVLTQCKIVLPSSIFLKTNTFLRLIGSDLAERGTLRSSAKKVLLQISLNSQVNIFVRFFVLIRVTVPFNTLVISKKYWFFLIFVETFTRAGADQGFSVRVGVQVYR